MVIIEDKKQLCENPMVSACILTYNQESTIAQAIEGFLNQDCDFPYEIIIGDDVSTDRTLEICKEYQAKYPHIIRIVSPEKNGGVMSNFYNCFRMSRGKYRIGHGGDDYCHNPSRMRLQVEYMESHPKCGLVHSDYNVLYNNTSLTEHYNKHHNIEVKDKYSISEVYNNFMQSDSRAIGARIVAPTCCWRKSILDQHYPISKIIELGSPIEDWPMYMYAAAYSEINYLPISSVTYRKGHESLSNFKSYEKVKKTLEAGKRIYMYITEEFGLDGTEERCNKYIAHSLLWLAYRKCDYKIAHKYSHVDNTRLYKMARNPIKFHIYYLYLKYKNALNS